MTKLKSTLLLAGALALLAIPALAAGLYTNGLPTAGGSQYPSTLPLTGNETIPADTNLTGGQNPATEAITVNALRSSVLGTPGMAGMRNALIGGDFGQNLWSRGTSVGSITTTYLYTANNWFAWSGTSTTTSVAQDSTAAERPATTQYAAKVSRTGSGVVQVCFAQEVESENSYRFAGNTAELDFSVYAGAGFSAASGNLQVYILYGTGNDEGAQKMAWGLNGGGGGSTAWTGMANAINSAAIGGVNPTTTTVALTASTLARYAAVANIPATATELGVALCWKPVGGSPSNDYLAFSNVQLSVNNNLAAFAGTITNTASGIAASSFEHRSVETEVGLEQRYAYAISEPASNVCVGSGYSATTTAGRIVIANPVTMRAAPTVSSQGTALSNATWQVQDANTPIVLSTPFLATYTANTPQNITLTATTGASQTAGHGILLCGAGGGNQLLVSADL